MSFVFLFFCFLFFFFFFFFQAEDGIRDADVTGVQTCALPISLYAVVAFAGLVACKDDSKKDMAQVEIEKIPGINLDYMDTSVEPNQEIGRASCRERV